jgi:hypothetical protein
MTKLLIAAVFSMVFVGSAIAADLPTDARVPTGIDVRGTVDYKLCKGRVESKSYVGPRSRKRIKLSESEPKKEELGGDPGSFFCI